MPRRRTFPFVVFLFLTLLLASAVSAQQTGAVSGKVSTSDGQGLPGVTVEARSNVLPQARISATMGNGNFNLPALAPGTYTVTFTLAGMRTVTRTVQVLLDQSATVNVEMAVESVSETITITADSPLIDPTSTAIKSAVNEDMIQQVPTGQDYRDLLKLAPGGAVHRGRDPRPERGRQRPGQRLPVRRREHQPSAVRHALGRALVPRHPAGGDHEGRRESGRLQPLRRLHDGLGQQVRHERVVRRAEVPDPERRLHGGCRDDAVTSIYDQDSAWATAGLGGPILRDRLYFYGSVLQPRRVDRAELVERYGDAPDYESNRDEFFGKLTITPIGESPDSRQLPRLRAARRQRQHRLVRDAVAPVTTRNRGTEDRDPRRLLGHQQPELRDVQVQRLTRTPDRAGREHGGQRGAEPLARNAAELDNLAEHGLLHRPVLSGRTARTEYSSFAQPIIDKLRIPEYERRPHGRRRGRGRTLRGRQQRLLPREPPGSATTSRSGRTVTHDIHVGAQQYRGLRDCCRELRTGGERVSVPAQLRQLPGGHAVRRARATTTSPASSASRAARGRNPSLNSYFESTNFEINDTIRWGNWSFNVGLMMSKDTLFGQGLKNDSSAVSGYVLSPGDQIRDVRGRLRRRDPAAPRRDLGLQRRRHRLRQLREVHPGGQLAAARRVVGPVPLQPAVRGLLRCRREKRSAIGRSAVPRASSSSTDLDPRYTDEFILGTSKQMSNAWTARAYTRYRYSDELLGRHEQQRARRLPARRQVSRVSSISRTSTTAAADLRLEQGDLHRNPQRVVLRHRRDGRRLHEILGSDARIRSQDRQGEPERHVHLEPLLRQLRPGQYVDEAMTLRSSSARPTSRTIRAARSGTTNTAISAPIGAIS